MLRIILNMRFVIIAILITAFGFGCGSDGSEDFLFLPSAVTQNETILINYPEGYSPPKIIIESPVKGTILPVDSNNLTVSGRVERGDNDVISLMVNDNETQLDANSGFQADVPIINSDDIFVSIEFSAKDSNNYCGRNRVSYLRGDTVDVEEPCLDAVNVKLGQELLTWAANLDPLINYLLSQEDLVNQVIGLLFNYPFKLTIPNPFNGLVELNVNDIKVHNDNPVGINTLNFLDPNEDEGIDAGRVHADFDFNGLEIDLSLKFCELAGIKFPESQPPVHLRILVHDMNAQADLRINATDSHHLSLRLIDLKTDVKHIEIILADLGAFGERFPLQIKNFMASIVNIVLSTVLDNLQLLSLELPDEPINLGMVNYILNDINIPLGEDSEPLNMGSVFNADFSALNASMGIGRLFGDATNLRVSLDLAGWTIDDVVNGLNFRDYDRALYLSPSVTVEDALIPSEAQADIALALSQNLLNRMFTAMADIDLVLSVPSNETLQSMVPILTENSVLELSLNTPPVIGFMDGSAKMMLPNGMVKIYAKGEDGELSLKLHIALDLIAAVNASVETRDEDYYMSFDLSILEFNELFIVDRMGISGMMNMEQLINGVLLPQIVEMLKATLEVPLKISTDQMIPLLFPVDEEDQIPSFAITVPEIRMDGGYVSVFIDMQDMQ